ncbi:MFS transporter [Elioraea sp.]|uniref:MFS transporter n=1 Tax=Elioraea sp. TaxID=2185103 RepID=UPI0025BE9241|nr:MFS transporter [Elioraea sp.]
MPQHPRLLPLLGGAAGLHAGDQLAMAALPLAAMLALGGNAPLVGLLLAVQASAWLVCSLPAGLAVDRFGRAGVLRLAATLAAAGLSLAALGAVLRLAVLLAAGAFAGSAGTVLFVLAAGSAVPDLVARDRLAAANARLELARALVTLAAPPIAGLAASLGRPELAFALAALAAGAAHIALARMPVIKPAPAAPGPRLRAALVEGGRFLLREKLLRGIALCAVFWNMGFFALLAAFVPHALGTLGMGAAAIGLAQGGYGAGLLAGAIAAPLMLGRFGPAPVLFGGPAVSVLAPMLLLGASPGGTALPLSLAALFLIGAGPMMWLICQQSIRQAVTPRPLLGRVGAALQMAIYGVRPAGALAGGMLAEAWGPRAGIALALVLFLLSLGAVCVSALGRLRRMPVPEGQRAGA